jgi:hypothetical protein
MLSGSGRECRYLDTENFPSLMSRHYDRGKRQRTERGRKMEQRDGEQSETGTGWARTLLGLLVGISCYLSTTFLLATPLMNVMEDSWHPGRAMGAVLSLASLMGCAVLGGLFSGLIDRVHRRHVFSALIIGPSVPVLFWLALRGSHTPWHFDPVATLAGVAAAWVGRVLSTRQKTSQPSTGDLIYKKRRTASTIAVCLSLVSWYLIGMGVIQTHVPLAIAGVAGLAVTIVAGIALRSQAALWTVGAPFLSAGLFMIGAMVLAFFARPPQEEQFAVTTLRTINVAQVTYYSTASRGNYGTFDDLVKAALLDDRFISGPIAGHTFTMTVTNDGQDYVVTAIPSSRTHGQYGYYSLPDAIIRYSPDPLLSPRNLAGRPIE